MTTDLQTESGERTLFERLALEVTRDLVALELAMSRRRPRVARESFESGLSNLRAIIEIARRGRR